MHRPWQYNHCQNSIRMQNKARDMESQNHGQINIQKVNTVSQTCRNCGDKYPHEQQQQCPAQGKTWRKCGKSNHFAKVCQSGAAEQNRPQNKQCPQHTKTKSKRKSTCIK